jgi:hypothetical protein
MATRCLPACQRRRTARKIQRRTPQSVLGKCMTAAKMADAHEQLYAEILSWSVCPVQKRYSEDA